MTTSETSIVREIPLSKLKPSPHNVRRTSADDGIAELAASIAAHGLLQMPVVTPELDGDGAETGCYLVTAGERRRKALVLLAKDKRIKKTAAIPCLVRDDGNAAELSLAENVVRVAMHPADQFDAFAGLQQQGLGLEAIAARFGVMPAVVRQRLKLAAVSPKLMKDYREGALTLDQLMALVLTDDHVRQEAVVAQLSWNRSPEMIRRLLTEGQVAATDRRVAFVGLDAYETAGGAVLRDLFADDHGGWLTDSVLLDRLVQEKLEQGAAEVRREGWRWVEVHPEYPYGMVSGWRRVYPRPVPLTADDQVELDALQQRYEALAAEHEHEDELAGEVATELETLTAGIEALEQRGRAYSPEETARTGAIVCLGADGALRIERGLIRRTDEAERHRPKAGSEGTPAEDAEPGGLRPLPDTLLAELTAERTLALQACLAETPEMALVALTHALALRVFLTHGRGDDPGSCLGLEIKPAKLGVTASVEESKAGRAMTDRHGRWAGLLPAEADALWDWLLAQSQETRLELLAYCVARTVDAVRRVGAGARALRHADRLAQALGLDMAQWWAPNRAGYLGRVTKARILEAVREGVSPRDAETIAGLRKAAMAEHAERLLAGKDWLPEPLRSVP